MNPSEKEKTLGSALLKRSCQIQLLEKEAILSKKERIGKMRKLLLVLKEDYEERREWLSTAPIIISKAPKFKRSPTFKKAEIYTRIDQRFDKKIKTHEDKIISAVMSKSDVKTADFIRKTVDEEYRNVREEMEQIRSRKHAGKEYSMLSVDDKKIIDDDIDLCIAKEKAKMWREMEKKIDTVILSSRPVEKRQQSKRFKIKVYHFDEVDELKKVNRKKYNDFVVHLEIEAKDDTYNFEKSLRSQIDVDNIVFTDIVSRKRKDNEESIKKHNTLKVELFIQELNMNLKVLLGEKLFESYSNNEKALIEIEDLNDVWNRMANRINLNAFRSIMNADQALLRINVEFDILHEDISDGTDRTLFTWDTFVGLVGDFWASAADESVRKRFDDRMLLYSAIYYSVRGQASKQKNARESKRALLDEKLSVKIEELKCRRNNLLCEICMLDEEIKTIVISRQRKKMPSKLKKDIAAKKRKQDNLELKNCINNSLILNDNTGLQKLQEVKNLLETKKKRVNVKRTKKQCDIDYVNSLWLLNIGM